MKAEFEVGCANQITNASSNLDILKQTPSTNELATKSCHQKIVDFQMFPSGFERNQVIPSMVGKTRSHVLPNPRDCRITN
jgi:hypothetical protein